MAPAYSRAANYLRQSYRRLRLGLEWGSKDVARGITDHIRFYLMTSALRKGSALILSYMFLLNCRGSLLGKVILFGLPNASPTSRPVPEVGLFAYSFWAQGLTRIKLSTLAKQAEIWAADHASD